MTKDTILSLIRSFLTAAGAFLIGKNIFGQAATSDTIMLWVGILVTVVSTVWGIVDKTTGVDQWGSALRSIITAIGGYLVARGIINDNTVQAILSILAIVIPALQSQNAKNKVVQIAQGKIAPVESTGKTVNIKP